MSLTSRLWKDNFAKIQTIFGVHLLLRHRPQVCVKKLTSWFSHIFISYWQFQGSLLCKIITFNPQTHSHIHGLLMFLSFCVSDELCERAVQGHSEGMGTPGLHRSFIWGGAPYFRQDWRPHSWYQKGLYAGEKMFKIFACLKVQSCS